MDSHQSRCSLREDMFLLIKEYLAGSQTQKEFCFEHKISFAKFTYWLNKFRKINKRASFIPLSFTMPSVIGDTRIELPNGIAIIFNGSANTAFIGEIISKAME